MVDVVVVVVVEGFTVGWFTTVGYWGEWWFMKKIMCQASLCSISGLGGDEVVGIEKWRRLLLNFEPLG